MYFTKNSSVICLSSCIDVKAVVKSNITNVPPPLKIINDRFLIYIFVSTAFFQEETGKSRRYV